MESSGGPAYTAKVVCVAGKGVGGGGASLTQESPVFRGSLRSERFKRVVKLTEIIEFDDKILYIRIPNYLRKRDARSTVPVASVPPGRSIIGYRDQQGLPSREIQPLIFHGGLQELSRGVHHRGERTQGGGIHYVQA